MKAFFWSGLLAVLCFAAPAQAQYGNHRIGVGIGAMYFSAKDVDSVLGVAPLAVEYSLYIENGFDVGAQVPLVILFDTVSKRQHFATGINFNFRYLLLEEYIRPYLGVQLGGLYIFRREHSFFFDIGPIAGVDFFIAEAWSIGPRLFANAHLMLNERVRFSFGGFFSVHTYF
jgi:outer membrane protein